MGVSGPITLTIDVLSFEGFTASQANDAAEAFRGTLAMLIETRGLPAISGSPAVSMEVPQGEIDALAPARTGTRLALALYRGLGG